MVTTLMLRAGMRSTFARARDVKVVERVPGSSSTDFWGIAHVPSHIERDVLSPADLERRLQRHTDDHNENAVLRAQAGGDPRDDVVDGDRIGLDDARQIRTRAEYRQNRMAVVGSRW